MGRRVNGRRVRRWLRERDGLAPLLGLSSRDRDELLWQAHRRLVRGPVDEAEALYQAMLTLWPNLVDARLGVGACLQSRGDLVEAEAAYGEALAIEPANPLALADRAEVRLLLGRLAEAVADLDAATALPPRMLRRHRLAGRVEALRAIALSRSADNSSSG
jgi:tetratricopeptide (TPR) repeat protein